MNSRRTFLATAALSVPALAGAASGAGNLANNPAFKDCPRANGGPNAHRFPQVIVQDQHKQKAWFYEQLINNKLVLINFTSVKSEKRYPIIGNLVRVQDMLADRLGDDVNMYTISTDPYHDTPEALQQLAESHGAQWKFLTGQPDDIREILHAFGVHGSINGLTWIGNEKTGRWLSKASRQHPLFIAEAVARLSIGRHHKPFLVDLHSV
ncbi:SCO family protein [Methylomarinum sp. Ch1-1]|uniref:SCO family protein n=1 Tax=Methylomarinum roseum TaxID=3067653 RepID=A0AAU7NVN6_9GAMM|nr:SCO family protein [Methylomarinum sp. Ch1-1]MDP4522953.1 SCO family protein [Methylomarinum sp. Ch1-1]